MVRHYKPQKFKGNIPQNTNNAPQSESAVGVDPAIQDYLDATVLGPAGVSNPDQMHDENPATRAAITNTGNNQFILDLGSVATRPLKAVVGQFRSPYAPGNNWTLDWSATSSTGPWTQVDFFNTTANGVTLMDGGTPNFRWCRCKYQISFATWNVQAYMGTVNS